MMVSVASHHLLSSAPCEAAGLERLRRVLGEDERVVAEQVIDVHALGGQELVILAVADREAEVLVRRVVDDERLGGPS